MSLNLFKLLGEMEAIIKQSTSIETIKISVPMYTGIKLLNIEFHVDALFSLSASVNAE